MFQTVETKKTWCKAIINDSDSGNDSLLLSKTNQLLTELKHDIIKEEEKEEEKKKKSTMTLDKYKKNLDEFFNYTGLLSTIQEYYNAYQHYFETQNNMDLQKIKEQLGQTKDLNDQLILVQMVAYITLGSFCENDHVLKSDQKFIINNELINKDLSEWINLFFKLLVDDIHKNKSTTADRDNENNRILHEKLIDTYITTIYLLIITSQSLEKNIVLNEDIPVQLFSILTIKNTSLYNNKKFYLLIYKVLIIYFGDMDQIKLIKDQIRSFYDLPPIDHDKPLKSSPDDLYDFQCEIKDKYTDYQLPYHSITTTATTLLSKTESLSLSEQDNDNIKSPPPFQNYFPPKLKSPPTTLSSSSSSSTITTRNNLEDDSPSVIEFKKQLEKKQSKTPFILGTPKAIEEAGKLYISYMNLSISQYQIIQELEKWIKNQDLKVMKQYEHPILHKVEVLYNSIVQKLPNIATTLLEQLVIMAPTLLAPKLDSMDWNNNNNNSDEFTDIIRNREIIRTTISSILILLLKWFKTSHIMKFEYLSQLLVDHGYLMLSIRSLMIEDMKTINESNVDNQKYGFSKQINLMNFNHEEGGSSSSTSPSSSSPSSSFSIPYSWEEPEQEKEDLDSLPCNQRNKDWLLNTLRILQMITKGKPLRSRILATYKAFIPLKRITKYNKNSIEELYALKVLKSQVRYLGHKWREENMKTISAISRRCSMTLRDDWLSQCDDDNMNNNNYNELKLENNMRILVKLYHEHQYDVNTEATVDQHYDDLKTNTSGNGHCNGIEDNDDNTARNRLVQQINQLFKQPLQRRIESKNIIQVPLETDGWDAPTPTTTGSNKLSKKKNNDDIEDDDDEEENENRIMNGKNKNDPLENIDWGNLTEDELNTRISLVGEQTEQRWMNVDLNDPAYCKVLLDVETEIDDELIVKNDTFDDDLDVDPWSS